MSPPRQTASVALSFALVAGLAACPSRESVPNAARYQDASVKDSGGPPPKIILLIGDGMGEGQLAAASYFKTGAPESLSVHGLPVRGRISTASPSGTTDSAAAATAMASGALTWNGTVGLDLDDGPVENLVELAKEYGLATGIVTTTRLSHATPAGFTAHVQSRGQYQDIAAQMAALRPDVMLGGGLLDFESRGDDRDLVAELVAGDYHMVRTASELAQAPPSSTRRLLGLFADYHLPYRVDRSGEEDLPLLKDMSLAALERLDSDPQGFFLMIEGGRIDHAGHENHIERAIGETIGFDDTVEAVLEWARERDDVTILVTADHETGGLKVLEPSSQGAVPRVSWRWGSHTNATITLFGQGPGVDIFDGQLRDHRWVHSALSGLIRNQPTQPPHRIIPDGLLTDLLGPSVAQTRATDATGGARLSRLTLDSDERGLGIGIEGLFPWSEGATLVLLDVDYGLATGLRSLGDLRDSTGSVDALLSQLDLPDLSDYGFGIDMAFVTQGGLEPKFEQLLDTAGLRGLRSPYGSSSDFGFLRSASNFSDHSRIYAEQSDVISGQGLEIFIRWQELYDGKDAPPEGTEIAVWVLQIGDDSTPSNQSLPPWSGAEGQITPNPLVISP